MQTKPDVIKAIFYEMRDLYSAWWSKQYKDPGDVRRAMNTWLSHLDHLTPEQIRHGFNVSVRQADYVPDIRSIIRNAQPTSSDLGLPTDDQAFRAWLRTSSIPRDIRSWSDTHPAVYWCHQCLTADLFNLSKRPEKDQKAAFMEFWREAKDMAAKGEPFTNRLDAPMQAPQPPVEAQKPETDSDTAERTPAHQAQVEVAEKWVKIIRDNLANSKRVNG